jgi:ABC-2 type transport system ATP-binding protein
VIERQHLATSRSRADLAALAERSGQARRRQTARSAARCTSTGRDAAALEATLREAPRRPPSRRRIPTGLEDVFIHLMREASDNFAPSAA